MAKQNKQSGNCSVLFMMVRAFFFEGQLLSVHSDPGHSAVFLSERETSVGRLQRVHLICLTSQRGNSYTADTEKVPLDVPFSALRLRECA